MKAMIGVDQAFNGDVVVIGDIFWQHPNQFTSPIRSNATPINRCNAMASVIVHLSVQDLHSHSLSGPSISVATFKLLELIPRIVPYTIIVSWHFNKFWLLTFTIPFADWAIAQTGTRSTFFIKNFTFASAVWTFSSPMAVKTFSCIGIKVCFHVYPSRINAILQFFLLSQETTLLRDVLSITRLKNDSQELKIGQTLLGLPRQMVSRARWPACML
jgi:hypothetical protein